MMNLTKLARTGLRLAAGAACVLHGVAHAPGMLAAWKLATFEDVSYQPNFLLETASNGVVRLLGAVWLVAGVAFIVAGIGILRQAAWRRRVALVATLMSLAVSVLWREDAAVGLVINLGVLALLGALWMGTTWRSMHGQPSWWDTASPA